MSDQRLEVIDADVVNAAVVRTRRIELVDKNERLRAVFDLQDAENPRLLLADANGQARLTLGVLPSGANIHLTGKSGTHGINLTFSDEGGSAITLAGPDGNLSLMLQVDGQGKSSVALFDQDGQLKKVME